MKTFDPAIEEIRSVRKKISQEASHDPVTLIQHYIEYQRGFGKRLVESPEHREDSNEDVAAAEPAPTPDAP